MTTDPSLDPHRAGSNAILIKDLRKTYQTKSGTVPAVEHFDLNIEEGTFCSLLGPSGCGKSTVLKVIGGLVPYDEGNVSVFGQPAQAGRRDVGVMFQTPVLLPWRTVLKNIELPLELFKEPKEAARRTALRLLEVVGLKDFANKYPWELSGGMQQRAALCRVLATDPGILLMDEPLAALDEFTRERLVFEIASIHERMNRTVMYVTHDIKEALILSDIVVLMTSHPGRIAGIVEVDLPRPRHPDLIASPEFAALTGKIREVLRLGTDGEL